jgi:hypothetical protein
MRSFLGCVLEVFAMIRIPGLTRAQMNSCTRSPIITRYRRFRARSHDLNADRGKEWFSPDLPRIHPNPDTLRVCSCDDLSGWGAAVWQ